MLDNPPSASNGSQTSTAENFEVIPITPVISGSDGIFETQRLQNERRDMPDHVLESSFKNSLHLIRLLTLQRVSMKAQGLSDANGDPELLSGLIQASMHLDMKHERRRMISSLIIDDRSLLVQGLIGSMTSGQLMNALRLPSAYTRDGFVPRPLLAAIYNIHQSLLNEGPPGKHTQEWVLNLAMRWCYYVTTKDKQTVIAGRNQQGKRFYATPAYILIVSQFKPGAEIECLDALHEIYDTDCNSKSYENHIIIESESILPPFLKLTFDVIGLTTTTYMENRLISKGRSMVV
jgi:hypothetical protein